MKLESSCVTDMAYIYILNCERNVSTSNITCYTFFTLYIILYSLFAFSFFCYYFYLCIILYTFDWRNKSQKERKKISWSFHSTVFFSLSRSSWWCCFLHQEASSIYMTGELKTNMGHIKHQWKREKKLSSCQDLFASPQQSVWQCISESDGMLCAV